MVCEETNRMGPSVNGELMPAHVFALKYLWTRDCARADDEECRLELLLVKVLKEVGSIRRWTIAI